MDYGSNQYRQSVVRKEKKNTQVNVFFRKMLSQSNYHYNKYTKAARQKEVRFPQFEDWNKKLINDVVCGLVDPLLIEKVFNDLSFQST